LCKTILTIRHKSKSKRDMTILLGVRDNQPSVTTAISRSIMDSSSLKDIITITQ